MYRLLKRLLAGSAPALLKTSDPAQVEPTSTLARSHVLAERLTSATVTR